MKKYVFFMLLAFGSQEGESMRRQGMPAGNMQNRGMSMHELVQRARSGSTEERDSALAQIETKYRALKREGRECRDIGKKVEAQLNKAVDAAKKNKQAAEAYKSRSDVRKGQISRCLLQITDLTGALGAKEDELRKLDDQMQESFSKISELEKKLARCSGLLAPWQQLDDAALGNDVEKFKTTLGGLLESADSAKLSAPQISLLGFVEDMCEMSDVAKLMDALKTGSGLIDIVRDTFGVQPEEDEDEPGIPRESGKPGDISEQSDSGKEEEDAQKTAQMSAEEEDKHEPRTSSGSDKSEHVSEQSDSGNEEEDAKNGGHISAEEEDKSEPRATINDADESNQGKNAARVSRVSSEGYQEEVANSVSVVSVSEDDEEASLLKTTVQRNEPAPEQASMSSDEEAA